MARRRWLGPCLSLLAGLAAVPFAPGAAGAGAAAPAEAAALGLPGFGRWVGRAELAVRPSGNHPLFRSREEALRELTSGGSDGPIWQPPRPQWRETYAPLEDPEAGPRRFAFRPESSAYAAAVGSALALPSEPSGRVVGGEGPAGLAGVWTQIGAGIENGSHDYAGRLTELAYAFDDTQGLTTLWAGSVGGGLWKFVVAFPFGFWARASATLPGSPSVGSFVVRGSSSAEILVGTGDFARYAGSGIYRTVDGGAHWSLVPLGATPNAVLRMREDWFASGTVLAATDAGLFRSTDFGGAWAAPTGLPAGMAVTDVVQDPVGPEYWYAAVWGDGVYLSADGGLSFRRNTDPASPICVGGANPIPGTFGRTGFAISADAANFVYALVENGNNGLTGVFRSADYGCHWAAIDGLDAISWGQGHAHAIAADPLDADRLFVGMGGLQYTENATAPAPCWVRNTGGGCAPSCGAPCVDGGHADFTDALFVPQALVPGNTTVLLANDGGYYAYDWVAHTVDGSGNRMGLNAIQVMQPHQALAAAHGDPSLLIAGLQDNGVVSIRTDLEPAILYRGGGDGGQVSVSPDDAAEWHASWGSAYNRYSTLAAGAPWFAVNCGLGNEWAMSMQKDPTPGFSNEVFTYSDTETAQVTGVQNLAATPLAAAETLTVALGLVGPASVDVPLAAGWRIGQVRTAVDSALSGAGIAAATVGTSGALRVDSLAGGADQFLRVSSTAGAGPGTAGFGPGGISDFGTDGFLRYKPVGADCDWSLVNPGARLPVAPIFHAKQVDQANNASAYLLYATAWFDPRLLVFDGGAPGAMVWEDRTPPLPPPTSSCREGFAFADRANARPRAIYYTTGCTRPSRALFSLNAGGPGSWFDITGNLATLIPTASFWELVGDPTDPHRFLLGTDVGIFRTDHAEAIYPVWYRWMDGLPAVVDVMNLELSSDGLVQPLLRIGTFGQGFWQRPVGPAAFLFADSFEAGSTIAWSLSVL